MSLACCWASIYIDGDVPLSSCPSSGESKRRIIEDQDPLAVQAEAARAPGVRAPLLRRHLLMRRSFFLHCSLLLPVWGIYKERRYREE